MSDVLPTVKVVTPGGHVDINASDFKPGVHTLAPGEVEPVPAPPVAPPSAPAAISTVPPPEVPLAPPQAPPAAPPAAPGTGAPPPPPPAAPRLVAQLDGGKFYIVNDKGEKLSKLGYETDALAREAAL